MVAWSQGYSLGFWMALHGLALAFLPALDSFLITPSHTHAPVRGNECGFAETIGLRALLHSFLAPHFVPPTNLSLAHVYSVLSMSSGEASLDLQACT